MGFRQLQSKLVRIKNRIILTILCVSAPLAIIYGLYEKATEKPGGSYIYEYFYYVEKPLFEHGIRELFKSAEINRFMVSDEVAVDYSTTNETDELFLRVLDRKNKEINRIDLLKERTGSFVLPKGLVYIELYAPKKIMKKFKFSMKLDGEYEMYHDKKWYRNLKVNNGWMERDDD